MSDILIEGLGLTVLCGLGLGLLGLACKHTGLWTVGMTLSFGAMATIAGCMLLSLR